MPPQRCGLIPRTLQIGSGANCLLRNISPFGSCGVGQTEGNLAKQGKAAEACCVTLAAEGKPPSSLLLHHCCTDAALIYAIRRAKTRVLVRRLLRRKKIALGLCMHKHAEILARHGCHYHSAKVSSPSFSLSSSSFHIQFHTTV